MSIGKKTVTARDLVDEAKKRIVFLSICVLGLSYFMSLTSSSVLVNLPAAVLFIIILRYLSLDYDTWKKAASYSKKPSSANGFSQRKPASDPKFLSERSEWKRKVNSPIVEDAIDHFTRRIVSEWVTDLWYSRITPDRQGPEELVRIINGVLGEFSSRMKNINLIDLLTRDIVKLVCAHLELFRACQTKIEKQHSLPTEQRDIELKAVLYSENKLHPALFSAGAEYKVLQHLMDGLISFTFKPEDLQCSLFRYIVREILSCAVMRPVVNLANPRFINERIESVVISTSKTEQAISQSNGSLKMSSSQISQLPDPSVKGVELRQFSTDKSDSTADNFNGTLHSKGPLLPSDTRSTRSWSSLPTDSWSGDRGGIQRHHSGGEWGDALDIISRRKTEALAPGHFENMRTNSRNYKKKERIESVQQDSSAKSSNLVDNSKAPALHKETYGSTKGNKLFSERSEQSATGNLFPHGDHNRPGPLLGTSYEEEEDEEESRSSSSYCSENEQSSDITGLGSPGTKVWDGKSNRNLSVTHIHHPLESFKCHKMRKAGKCRAQSEQLPEMHPEKKRPEVSSQKEQVWQEVGRTSFTLRAGEDILSSKGNLKSEDSSESEAEPSGRNYSTTSRSSSFSSISMPDSNSLAINAQKCSLVDDSFLRLRCEVLGANIVKSGSKTFAVYSISVTDVNNVSWSIKRRFQHFEELHRRLKEYPEYNLHLPPKHFLSSGLDMPVIQERCKLLDIYLKRLMQLPTICGSIEVWDFLSVDSQTYSFLDSISIVETLSFNQDTTVRDRSTEVGTGVRPLKDPLTSSREHSDAVMKDSSSQIRHNSNTNGSRKSTKNVAPLEKPTKELGKPSEDSGCDSERVVKKNVSSTRELGQASKGIEEDTLHAPSELLMDDNDSRLPAEWVPPNLAVPMLDLVDVVFQLQDGGWIRRKAFWVAKQVLQLGMSDALDGWLIGKIQLLRRGSVVASGIRRLEQILWPDGIFITKNPKRQRPTPSPRALQVSHHGRPPPSPAHPPNDEEPWKLEELQEQEAQRRSKLVYELMIDKAPVAIVGLVGRKRYEQCAKDLYYFIQSSVCLKQLAFDLLELLLALAFPELDHVVLQLHDEKHKFGVLERD